MLLKKKIKKKYLKIKSLEEASFIEKSGKI